MLARNTILQSRYRIVRPLGKGGMGQVYEAIDDTVDSIVAIKETFANTDKLRNAFEHEAKLLASLRHPVLPRVMHHFLQGDGQFLVMDFVDGLSLAQLLDLRGLPFRYETVVPWTDKLLDALSYLHRQREPIIHRDIKPANIKVTNEGEVYLLDFGLAKGAPGQESSVHGYTAAYAPLEQLNNSDTNEQSDLYSLGATLYHLLTGHLPIPASKRNETLDDGGRDPLTPVHQSNPEIPESISAIISQAMAMKRRDRFASSASMREVLREATLLIEREREQKILETPTRLTDKASRSKEHKLVLRETEAAADLGDRRMVNPVVPSKDLSRQDVYQKTMDHVAPPVVPPPPPSDPAERSWPSRVDPEPGTSPDVEKEREEEERRRREAAEEGARRAEDEAKKRVEEERLLKEAAARQLAEEEERKRIQQETARQAKQSEKGAEERRLREEAERQRAAAEEHRLKQKIGTIPAPYIPQLPPIDPEVTQLAPLPVPPRAFWNKRRILIGAAATSVILTVVALSLFPPRGTDKGSDSVNLQQVNQQTTATQKTAPAPQESTASVVAPDRKLTKSEVNKVLQALSDGNSQRDAKRYSQAESEYRRALLINPNEARAHNGLGNVYYDQARYSDAIEEFKKAIKLDSNNAGSYYGLGNVYYDQGRYPEAITQFKKAIEIDPKRAESHYALGLAYLKTNNKAAATEQYEALKNLKPPYADNLRSAINK